MGKIWVKEKGREYKQHYIDEADFDPSKYIKPTIEEKQKQAKKNTDYWEGFKSGKNKSSFAIGSSKRNQDFGVTYNGKVDSGKVEELLDYGLENAQTRAMQRQSKYGSMFDKHNSADAYHVH